jgi:adenosylmethionine-8-amino-7-oxononanoate aminotransferase
MQGVELVADRATGEPFPAKVGFARAVVAEGLARDVWYYPAGTGHPVGDAVMFGPPFTISEDDVDEMVGVLKAAIDAAAAAL